VGDGGTHLARVDLLAAEGVVVGTHVGGVGAVPGVLVGGWSSVVSRLTIFNVVWAVSPR
jgi:hypothetical protein